ncbi:hypothetical protein PCE1_000696 [Barthelona sp. PCE]
MNHKKTHTTSELFGLNSIQVSIQLSFALTFLFVMKLEEALNWASWEADVSFTIGQLAGLLVNPIVGTLSDRHKSKLGRRRPFIIWGTIMIVIGIFLLGVLSIMLKDADNYTWATVSVLVGLTILNIGLNIVMPCARALIGDILPANESIQIKGNAICSCIIGVSNIAVNVIAYVLATSDGKGDLLDSCKMVCLVSMVLCAFFALITIFVGNEEPLKDEEAEVVTEFKKKDNLIIGLVKDMKQSPKQVQIIALTVLLSWIAMFPLQLKASVFFKWNSGALVLAGLGAGTLVASLISEGMAKSIGSQRFYSISLFCCFLGEVLLVIVVIFFDPEKTSFISQKMFVIFSFSIGAICGFCFSAMNALPFAMLKLYGEEKLGVWNGCLNAAIVIGQLISTALSAIIAVIFGWFKDPFEYNDTHTVWLFAIGAIISLFNFAVSGKIVLPKDGDAESEVSAPLLNDNGNSV